MSPRTRRLLQGAIVPTLLLMAWPNILVMTAQAATGLIETWWVSKLGTDALAGMALVFPGFMMMQMLSAGAIGGGIASAVARALGANRRADADALVLHALLINLGLGLVTSALFLIWGRPIYAAMGGEGASLEAALAYSNVVFAGNVLVWLMNALGSLIRGTGNMLVPALSVCLAVALLIPLSPLLIFGWGPVPAMGIAGGGYAVLITSALTTAVLAWYLLAGRSIVRLRRARLQWPMFADILRVGGVGTISTLQTSLTVALTTALVGSFGGPNAVAGYGTGARIEYLLIPLVFGLGAPLVALVGTNIGAGQPQRALRIALIGGALAFALTETIGIVVAIWPAGLARPVRQRPADARGGRRLPARRRSDLRLLRPRPLALLRVAGRRPAGLAAARRHGAAVGRRRRRLAGALAHRLARLGLRGAGAGAGGLRRDRRRSGRFGGVVPAQVIALRRERLRAAAGQSPTQAALGWPSPGCAAAASGSAAGAGSGGRPSCSRRAATRGRPGCAGRRTR